MTAQFVRLLGRPELQIGDQKTYWNSGQVAQLLLYLAYKADWINREQIIFLIWPDETDEVARRNLRRLLHRVKKQVEEVESDGELLRWVVTSDIQKWREALEKQDWGKAFDLYQGPFLEAFDAGKSVEFANWIEQEREELFDTWREAFFDHMLKLQNENPDQASELIKRFLALDPLNELTLQSYLKCLAAAGQHDSLERVYQTFARRLDAELGLEPSEETLNLVKQLKKTQVEVVEKPQQKTPQIQANEYVPDHHSDNSKVHSFVGREHEIKRLSNYLELALSGQGMTIAIEGEAGIGKTKLVEEFLGNIKQVQIFSGRCFERELAAPFEPIHAAIQSLTEEAPQLKDDSNFWTADVNDLSNMHQGMTATLISSAKEQGAILFIDDLQWADAATLEFLAYAAKRIHSEPILIILTFRREDQATLENWLMQLAERRAITHIHLERLEPLQTESLLSEFFEVSNDDLKWLASFLQQESEGNPFFVMEYLRWLQDIKVIELDDSKQITSLNRNKIQENALPEGVRTLVRSRIQSLDKASRNILNLATVIGRSFTYELLEAASRQDAMELWSSFEPLLTAGLVLEATNEQYILAHDKIRQTVYENIPLPLQRTLHSKVAGALRNQKGDDAELAHHYLRAQSWADAFKHLNLAAQQAETNQAWESALRIYTRALDIFDRSENSITKRFELLQAYERLYEYMDRRVERAKVVKQLLDLAQQAQDSNLLAEAQLKHMAVLIQAGYKAAAMEAHEKAIKLFSKSNNTGAEARAYRELAYAAWQNADFEGVLNASFKALGLYQALDEQRAEAAILSNIAQAYRHLGNFDESLKWAEKAGDIYQGLGNPLGEYIRLDTRAWVHMQRGDTAAATVLIEQLLPITEQLNDKHLLVEKYMNLGRIYLEAGKIEKALEYFQESARRSAKTGDPRHEGYPLMNLGACLQHLGKQEQAIQAYRRATQLLETAYNLSGVADEHIAQAEALTLLANVLQNEPDCRNEALADFKTADLIFRKYEQKLPLSKLLMERGSFNWRLGNFDASANDFEEAYEITQELGELTRQTAALASLGVIYKELERYEDSINVSQKALEHLKQQNDLQVEAYVLLNLASNYKLLGKLEDARINLKKSLELRRLIGDVKGEAEVLKDLNELESISKS